MLKAVLGNSWCDAKVVAGGAKAWVSGKQPAPWSNYIFIPELPEDENFDNAARAEYFKTNPDIAVEMQDLKQLNKELENEQPDFNPAEQPE